MQKIFIVVLLTLTTLLASQMGVVQGLDPHGDGFLSLRVKPKSKEIGKLYNGDELEILDKNGKYYKVKDIKSSKVGWAHGNWIKSISNKYFLLADIDSDGKKERLQWDSMPSNDPEVEPYQLKLFDDNGDLLWEGPRGNLVDNPLVVGYEYESGRFPMIFADIDGDGNTEMIISSPPHEGEIPGSEIYRWTGEKFISTTSTQYLGLIWIDAPHGKTLKWTKIDSNDYDKRKKRWFVGEFFQMPNNELPMVDIAGVQYPEFSPLFRSNAKIRFTPTGAVIEEWIK